MYVWSDWDISSSFLKSAQTFLQTLLAAQSKPNQIKRFNRNNVDQLVFDDVGLWWMWGTGCIESFFVDYGIHLGTMRWHVLITWSQALDFPLEPDGFLLLQSLNWTVRSRELRTRSGTRSITEVPHLQSLEDNKWRCKHLLTSGHTIIPLCFSF